MSCINQTRHTGMITSIGSPPGAEFSTATSSPVLECSSPVLQTSQSTHMRPTSPGRDHHIHLPQHHHPHHPNNHSHHHTRHNIHKHMHNGQPTKTLSSKDTSPETPVGAIIHEEQPHEQKVVTVVGPVTGTFPPESGRGRSRIVRRGGRSSSSESGCSSMNEQEIALSNHVKELVQMYSKGGDAKELARIARENGIPPPLRMVVWPILLECHPFVKEKSLAKEYRHAEETYTPRDIPVKRIQGELGRYHRRKNHTPSTRTSSPPSSNSPATSIGAPPSKPTIPTDPAALDEYMLDTAVEEAIVSFLIRYDGVTFARGMVYVCLALAEWIFLPPSALAAHNQAKAVDEPLEDSTTQSERLSKCFENMMCIMLWSPSLQTPTGRMEGAAEQRISTFLTECRQLVPELCVIMDEEEALGFEEEWVHSWVQWWCAKELSKDSRGRLWDWHLGYQKPAQRPDASGAIPDEGYEEAFSPSDWHILVCVALLKCLHDHVDDLEQSEIRSLLSNIPDRQLGSMSKIIEEAKCFRSQLKEIQLQEDEEYAASGAHHHLKASSVA